MEAERNHVSDRKSRPVSEKDTAFNLKERRSQKAAEARENSPALMALYNLFLPGSRGFRRPKFVTDKWGNRIRLDMQSDKEE